MKKRASHSTRKLVKAIYLMSLAEMLHKRLVMQRLNDLIVQNHIYLCDSEYNPPS